MIVGATPSIVQKAPTPPLRGRDDELSELFFRGVVFGVTATAYPEVGLWWAVALSTVLFAAQQASFCTTPAQGVALSSAAIGISVASCIAFAYSGSLLPCVLAHQAFLIFYTGRFQIY